MACSDSDLEELLTQIYLLFPSKPPPGGADSPGAMLAAKVFEHCFARARARILVPLLLLNMSPEVTADARSASDQNPAPEPRRILKRKLERVRARGTSAFARELYAGLSKEAVQTIRQNFYRALPGAIAEAYFSTLLAVALAVAGGSPYSSPRSAAPRDEHEMVRLLQAGRVYDMRNTSAPMDDRIPASYTVSCEHIREPITSEEQQRQRFYVAELDSRCEVKNIRVLGHSEATEWLRYKAGMACWQIQERGGR